MIDPVIFTIRLFGQEFPVRWYGVIVMIGIVVGALIVERELKRRGEKDAKSLPLDGAVEAIFQEVQALRALDPKAVRAPRDAAPRAAERAGR